MLLGVTGSGKTFTMANVIARVNRPTLVIAHNKTLAAQLYDEFKSSSRDNAVEYFVSYYDYYQPEAYVPRTDTYIEKDASINDEIDKLRHSATTALLERRDALIVAQRLVHLRPGLAGSLPRDDGLSSKKARRSTAIEMLRKLVDIQYERNDYRFPPRHVSGARRRGRNLSRLRRRSALRIEFFGDDDRVDLARSIRCAEDPAARSTQWTDLSGQAIT